MQTILNLSLPIIDDTTKKNIAIFLQGDLRKLNSINKMYNYNNDILKNELFKSIFKLKSYNEDTKEITQKLFNDQHSISEHNTIMNDTDRTIVGLLWHENVIDIISNEPKNIRMPLYKKILEQY